MSMEYSEKVFTSDSKYVKITEYGYYADARNKNQETIRITGAAGVPETPVPFYCRFIKHTGI